MDKTGDGRPIYPGSTGGRRHSTVLTSRSKLLSHYDEVTLTVGDDRLRGSVMEAYECKRLR